MNSIKLAVPGELPEDQDVKDVPLKAEAIQPYIYENDDGVCIFESNVMWWLEVDQLPPKEVARRIQTVESVPGLSPAVERHLREMRLKIENLLPGDDSGKVLRDLEPPKK